MIAHEHRLLISGLELLLAEECHVAFATTDFDVVVDAVREFEIDLAIVGLSKTPQLGIDRVSRLHHSHPRVAIAVLTRWDDSTFAAQALRQGASAYLLSSCSESEILHGLRAAVSSPPYVAPQLRSGTAVLLATNGTQRGAALTMRQTQLVTLVARGKSMKEIAEALHITPRTVAFHKYKTMRMLKMTSTAELVQFAVRQRLV